MITPNKDPNSGRTSKKKNLLLLLLKSALGLVLVSYVVRSNLVDFKNMAHVLFHPINIIVSFSILFVLTSVLAFRWFLLAKSTLSSISFLRVLEVTMIGQFFGTFLPGSLGGEIVRTWYLSRAGTQKNLDAVQTIFWDRLIGLTVTCLFVALATSLFSIPGPANENFGNLKFFSWAATLGLLSFELFFITVAKRWKLSPKAGSYTQKVWGLMTSYHPDKKTILISIALSLCGALITIALGIAAGSALNVGVGTTAYFFIVPIGVMVSAIPLLPLGIGLGQVAYANLFIWFGNSSAQNGATFCTLLQCYRILFSLTGLFLYLKGSKKLTRPELSESAFPLKKSS